MVALIIRGQLRISNCIIYFMLYSVFGWLYEVFLEMVVYRWGFSNRGVLFGPYLPVYGGGAMLFLMTVYPFLQRRKTLHEKLIFLPAVFVSTMAIATLTELLTSYLLEYFTGSWPWQTYRDYAINYQARIALSPSLRFGIGGVLFLYIFQPLFEKVTEHIGKKRCIWIASGFAVVFIVDAALLMIR